MSNSETGERAENMAAFRAFLLKRFGEDEGHKLWSEFLWDTAPTGM